MKKTHWIAVSLLIAAMPLAKAEEPVDLFQAVQATSCQDIWQNAKENIILEDFRNSAKILGAFTENDKKAVKELIEVFSEAIGDFYTNADFVRILGTQQSKGKRLDKEREKRIEAFKNGYMNERLASVDANFRKHPAFADDLEGCGKGVKINYPDAVTTDAHKGAYAECDSGSQPYPKMTHRIFRYGEYGIQACMDSITEEVIKAETKESHPYRATYCVVFDPVKFVTEPNVRRLLEENYLQPERFEFRKTDFQTVGKAMGYTPIPAISVDAEGVTGKSYDSKLKYMEGALKLLEEYAYAKNRGSTLQVSQLDRTFFRNRIEISNENKPRRLSTENDRLNSFVRRINKEHKDCQVASPDQPKKLSDEDRRLLQREVLYNPSEERELSGTKHLPASETIVADPDDAPLPEGDADETEVK